MCQRTDAVTENTLLMNYSMNKNVPKLEARILIGILLEVSNERKRDGKHVVM